MPPTVSVALITYNEERYVADAIRSVLAQTFPDLELVVFDNGSTDGTPAAVAGFTDARVRYIRDEPNRGVCHALNRAVAACTGRYVALLAGDDACQPDRLAVQLAACEAAGGGAVFSDVEFMDDAGRPAEAGHFPKDLFRLPPMTRAEFLDGFFRRGNFVHPITGFAPADVFRAAGPFDPALTQLGDYDWLVRLAKGPGLTVTRDRTVRVRTRADNGNLSAFSPTRHVRGMNEWYLVLNRFFDGLDPDLFRAAFGRQFRNPDSRTPAELACEQAFLLAAHPACPPARLLGVERLHALLADPAAASVLRDRFAFTPAAFADLLLRTDPLDLLGGYDSLLFVDTGAGFNAAECVRATANHAADGFELTYDLSAFGPVREVRWDPAELKACRVRLDAAGWRDRAGAGHTIDLDAVRSNGSREADGTFAFRTLDPMLFLPVCGEVREVTVRGRWQVADRPTSAAQTGLLLEATDARLRQAEAELRDRERRVAELEEALRERDRPPAQARGPRWLAALRSVLPALSRRAGASR